MNPRNISKISSLPVIAPVASPVVEDRLFSRISTMPRVGNPEVKLLPTMLAHSVEDITVSKLTTGGRSRALAMAHAPGPLRWARPSSRLRALSTSPFNSIDMLCVAAREFRLQLVESSTIFEDIPGWEKQVR